MDGDSKFLQICSGTNTGTQEHGRGVTSATRHSDILTSKGLVPVSVVVEVFNALSLQLSIDSLFKKHLVNGDIAGDGDIVPLSICDDVVCRGELLLLDGEGHGSSRNASDVCAGLKHLVARVVRTSLPCDMYLLYLPAVLP